MNETYQQQLSEQGATLIILELPEGTEFGIDLQVWKIGSKFTGIKMIPPGLHFIYFSIVSKYGDVAPRTGFFHYFELKEILVKKYIPLDEDLDDEDEKTVERIKLNLREIDQGLGPFPLDSWTRWVSFTQHISKTHLQRLIPKTGKICSVPELINEDSIGKYDISDAESIDKDKENADDQQVSNSAGDQQARNCADDQEASSSAGDGPSKSKSSESKPTLPSMIARPGTEIRYSKFPLKPYKEGASPSEISRGNIDSSYSMKFLFDQLDSPSSIMSEIQFSFVCFLVGQVWDSWEHWRKLVIAMCTAEDTLIENPLLYIEFLSSLHYQIQEVPEDLFADIVENKNFLVTSLRTFFANIFDNKLSLPRRLVLKGTKFRKHLISKFKWSLELEEEDEDLPVVVEL